MLILNNWSELTSSAPWSGRFVHRALAHGGYIWMCGGASDLIGGRFNDVWQSPNGDTWIRLTDNAGWVGRSGHCFIYHNGKFFVLGGANSAGNFLNDVWFSTDGIDWTQATAGAEWAGRHEFSALSYGGAIYIMGGYNGSFLSDVWKSTDDGASWTQTSSNLGIALREHVATIVNNKMWIYGGQNLYMAFLNSMYSSTDGVTWVNEGNAAWGVRREHQIVQDYDLNTKLLLHADGDDGSDVIVDSSTYALTPLLVSNVSLDTAQQKFGLSSLRFLPGYVNNNHIDYSDLEEAWKLGDGSIQYDRTIDFWIHLNTFPAFPDDTIVSYMSDSSDIQWMFTLYNVDNEMRVSIFIDNSTGLNLSTGIGSISTGAWYHVALVKADTSVKLFLDGDLVDSITVPSIRTVSSGILKLGKGYTASFDGWIDEFRILNRAQWSSSFTPPSAQYNPISSAAVVGGYNGYSYLDDIWETDDGINWTEIPQVSSFTPRSDFALANNNGKAFIMGGTSGSSILNDIWIAQSTSNPRLIHFEDTSTHTPISWDWDWGDGTPHGTEQYVSHEYADYETDYSVTLVVSNAGGRDEIVKTVRTGPETPVPEAGFTWEEVDIIAAPLIGPALAGDTQVTIMWGSVVGATSYNLYYKIGATVDKLTGTEIVGVTSSKVVTGLVNSTLYAFAVTAVDIYGESVLSSTVTATPSAGPPVEPPE